jgi:hypothetical protein
MKTELSVSIAVVLLLASMIATVQFVEAQPTQTIIIKPDGSVAPNTSLLERNGTIYTFKGDIFGTIWVQTGNIVIEGAGQTLQGNGVDTGQNSEIGILLGGPDLSHRICQNVLVKNLRINNIPRGVYSVGGSNNSFIGNYFDNSGMQIQGNANGTGDIVEHNSIVNAVIGFDYNPNGTDIIRENNFVNASIWLGLSNAPMVDRNYWSDYTAKYPDARELGNSGIWDTPYVYGSFERVNSSLDLHPLVNPITDFEILNFINPNATPTSSSSAETSPPNTSQSITILSPKNITYAAVGDPYSHIPLTYETNSSLSWVGYSLDSGANITVTQNGTVIDIPTGSRSLTLYANDTNGHWEPPQTVQYQIAYNGGTAPGYGPITAAVDAIVIVVVAIAIVAVLIVAAKKLRK